VSGGAQIAAIRGASGSSNLVFRVANTSSALFEAARLTSAGNLGVGTSTPYSRLTLWGADTAAGTYPFLIANSASTAEFGVDDAGNTYRKFPHHRHHNHGQRSYIARHIRTCKQRHGRGYHVYRRFSRDADRHIAELNDIQ
jgi:hypothetical protein